MDNKKIKDLRDTPMGYQTRIGRLYYSAILFAPREGYPDKVCSGCSFRKEGGAGECTYATACMAHLRPDRKSVIFVKIERE